MVCQYVLGDGMEDDFNIMILEGRGVCELYGDTNTCKTEKGKL